MLAGLMRGRTGDEDSVYNHVSGRLSGIRLSKIRAGIVGVGNCASGIIQGIELCKRGNKDARALGNTKIGAYRIEDIDFVTAFDVGAKKVGRPLSKAIYLGPHMVRWTDGVSGCD